MRLIHLPTFWTIMVDIAAWFIIHIVVVFIAVRIPARYFNPAGFFYRARNWEKKGAVYQNIFKIKRWKKYAPDGAEFLKKRGFPKKKLINSSTSYLKNFLLETCRAELTHWILIFFAPFFFFWNRFWVGLIMILYALSENIPLIMVQRYNRIRFLSILRRRGEKI
jgi:glycosyl-4,4'-diaponeurosporenoate acyltransferase